MSLAEIMVRPDRFWIGEAGWRNAAAVVDLDAGDPWPEQCLMPPCPVIGLGSRNAPGAGFVDVVVEPPASVEGLLAQIYARPLAAAAVVQLLRIIPALSIADALVAESLAYAVLQGSAEHRSWLKEIGEIPDTSGSPGSVLVNRYDAQLELVLDRAGAGNAIDRTMRDELHAAFQMAAIDQSIERVILRAKGKAFSLGADLAEFGTTTDPATAHAIRAVTLPASMAARIGDRFEAIVQGACVGAGLEIAAFAGRFVATRNAWFQLPELAMGILPGAGGCVSLTRRIGRQRAALLILSGKRLSASLALEWGLLDDVVNDLA